MSERSDQQSERRGRLRAARRLRQHAHDEGLDAQSGFDGVMSLAELTAAADVSVRTVRYYIAEGLLPPPEGAGPASAYTAGHLARLRLIQRLKEAYLPLKEIRRRLAGLDDDEVLALLAQEDAVAATAAAPDATLAGAREYLALLESRARYRTEPMPLLMAPSPAPSASLRHDLATPGADVLAKRPEPLVGEDFVPEVPSEARPGALWRRIPLGDEAELVISDRVYARHRDRIDWLVRWARKVFS